MPVKSRECIAVGVEPADTMGQGMPAARSVSAGVDDRQALLLGDRGDAVRRALVIGMAGMGHDAGELDARRGMQDARDVEQAGQLRLRQAGAAAAAVDLDEDRKRVAARRGGGDRPRDGEVVGDDPQVDAAAAQLGDRRQLRRHDADAIEDVREAAVGEIACLRQRRHGDAAVMAFDRHAADLDGFGGLEMRPQHHAGAAQAVAHALEVAAQDRPVENEGGGRQVVDRLVQPSRRF